MAISKIPGWELNSRDAESSLRDRALRDMTARRDGDGLIYRLTEAAEGRVSFAVVDCQRLFFAARDALVNITAERDALAAEVERLRALWAARGGDGCCCRFEEDGETIIKRCSVHAAREDALAAEVARLREAISAAEHAWMDEQPEHYNDTLDAAMRATGRDAP